MVRYPLLMTCPQNPPSSSYDLSKFLGLHSFLSIG
jgi:hypothetical protein